MNIGLDGTGIVLCCIVLMDGKLNELIWESRSQCRSKMDVAGGQAAIACLPQYRQLKSRLHVPHPVSRNTRKSNSLSLSAERTSVFNLCSLVLAQKRLLLTFRSPSPPPSCRKHVVLQWRSERSSRARRHSETRDARGVACGERSTDTQNARRLESVFG